MSLQQIPGHYIVSSSATGGGGSNCVYSTAVSATATASGQAFFTATQVPVSAYSTDQIIGAGYLGTADNRNAWIFQLQLSAITAAEKLSDLTITIPNYNYNPDVMSFYMTGSSESDLNYFGNQGPELLRDKYAPGQYTVPSATMLASANNFKNWYNCTYLYIIAMAWYGSYSSVAPSADMSGAALAGTSLPYPDRPTSETASASLSAVGYEWVAPSGAGWVSTATARGTAMYNNGVGEISLRSGYGSIGCSETVSYSSMNAGVSPYDAFASETYPETAYTFTSETANFAYGASGLVG